MKTKMIFLISIIIIIFSVNITSAYNPTPKKWKWELRNGRYVKSLINKPGPIQLFCYSKPYEEVCFTPSDTIGYRASKKSTKPQQYNNYIIAEGGFALPTGIGAKIIAGIDHDFNGILTALDFNSSLRMTKKLKTSADLFLAIGGKKLQYICVYGKFSKSPSNDMKLERFGIGLSVHFSQIVSPKILTRGYLYLIGGESFYRVGYYNKDEEGHVFGASFFGLSCYLAKDFKWGTIEGGCSSGFDFSRGQKTSSYYDVNTRIMKNILNGGRWHGQIGIGFDVNETDKSQFILVMRIAG